MIYYNQETRILSFRFKSKDDICKANLKLSKINPNIFIFKHENEYKIVDEFGKFHKVKTNQSKIKL